MSLSSPNRIIWNYFEALRRIVCKLESANDDEKMKQDVAIAIMLSVMVVEAFMNVYFRVVVSEDGFKSHESYLLKSLEKRVSLDKKLKDWPAKIMGASLDFTAGAPKRFDALRKKRNNLMHFTSSHESIAVPGVEFKGLADTSAFDGLVADDAVQSLETAESMVCEVFKLRGIPDSEISHALHGWTGKVPL